MPFLTKDYFLGFYGGEPLLAFSLIKNIVAFLKAKNKKYNKRSTFSITTNGYLLNDEIIQFLNDSKFHIVISYDGILGYFDNRGKLNKIIFFPDHKFFVEVRDWGTNFENNLKEIRENRKRDRLFSEVKTYYDLYSEDGYFLQSFSIDPEYGHIIYIDQNGFVYTKTGVDEIPIVRKYEFSFVEKK